MAQRRKFARVPLRRYRLRVAVAERVNALGHPFGVGLDERAHDGRAQQRRQADQEFDAAQPWTKIGQRRGDQRERGNQLRVFGSDAHGNRAAEGVANQMHPPVDVSGHVGHRASQAVE